MDVALLAALAALILLVIVGLTFFLKRAPTDTKVEPRQRPVPNRVRDGAPRRAQLARNRGARLRANAAQQEAQASDDENNAHEPEVDPEEIDGKIGAKKKAKLEAKAEKKAQRQAEELSRAEKKKKEQQAEEEHRKQQEKEKAEEKRLEEEERKSKEEKEKKDYEEYLKMKEAFSVEEEGYEEGEEGNPENLLQEFVNYIKKNKIVIIEDLAAQFKLKTQAVIDRLKDLQSDDILTGVIDDRGKFIYVSEEEMNAVAKFIRQRGRVTISELAENSNTLIDLSPVTVK